MLQGATLRLHLLCSYPPLWWDGWLRAVEMIWGLKPRGHFLLLKVPSQTLAHAKRQHLNVLQLRHTNKINTL